MSDFKYANAEMGIYRQETILLEVSYQLKRIADSLENLNVNVKR